MNDKHPPTFDCLLCNRQFAAPYALEDHYRGSQLHPNCVRCGRGFKDTAACDEVRVTCFSFFCFCFCSFLERKDETALISWFYCFRFSIIAPSTQRSHAHLAEVCCCTPTHWTSIIRSRQTTLPVSTVSKDLKTCRHITKYVPM